MPFLAQYRWSLAVESGPFVGPEVYDVRATSGSDTTKLVYSNYPIMSNMGQSDLLRDRPLYRPNATWAQDRHRHVLSYDPPLGVIVPDLPWTNPPITTANATTYGELEAFRYGELENLRVTYENLEGTGVSGIGERFEILGPWDVPTMHQLINDGLKQCWLVVDVPCSAAPGVTRHDLSMVTPWLQDPNHIRQAGMLTLDEDPAVIDPFGRIVYGSVERDGGTFIFNTGWRTFNPGDIIWLRCYKRAYDHCRAVGGTFGEQAGLALEDDEAPVERSWLTASALLIGWRRFGHMLEVGANQRLIRDQASAAAWFGDETHKHFTAVQPTLTFRPAKHFGPVFR